ncbi:YdeI/OmpD-associated family protein [Fuscibacter oryzae]|uniref:YdeI/OmpD-associated family protein n=1 Tax=Fuscibacter oryzae TaxID=2803939 RepID=A0A8J7MRE3_9RHOB|nr:YdeI/OmpD-associated family protein [Fuscibacter oryzae]MBL4926948.1 YdeI/OmpD-associated family protein [Fuscibacter oryzae]
MDWHDWLAANHATQSEVWVLYHKKGSGVVSIDWQQAVVEALAWGWIDGVRKTQSETQWIQRFTPRKPGSAWSQLNRAHAERLIVSGRMQAAGLAAVEAARANGRWEATYSGGKGADLPVDFLEALATAPQSAQKTFAALDAKERYAIYYRLTTAKRAETRTKRMAEFLARLAEGKSPV